MKKTELVQGARLFNTKNGMKYQITTASGDNIWVDESAYVQGAETITYEVHKPGDTFVAQKDSKGTDSEGKPFFLKGQTVTRLKGGIDFICFGKQNVRQYSKMELINAILASNPEAKFAL